MRTSQLKNRNSSYPIFSNSTETEGLELYKFSDNLSLTDITPGSPSIVSIGNGHRKTTINTPDEDCIVVGKFNEFPVIFNVGQPAVKFVHYHGETGKSIAIERMKDDGTIVETGTLTELGHGFYYHTPSDLGLSIYMIDGESHLMQVPYLGSTAGSLSGSILLQKDKWMLCAVPIDGKIHEDFVQKIESKYTVSGGDIFEVFNAYPSTDSQSSEFLSYIPGVTSPLTKHNFPLKMVDSTNSDEIIGFWIKTKNYAGSELVFDWSII